MTDLFVVLNGPHVQKDNITGQLEFYENERAAYSALSHCEDGCKVMKVEGAFILKPHTTNDVWALSTEPSLVTLKWPDGEAK
jgi:hypothetical protein